MIAYKRLAVVTMVVLFSACSLTGQDQDLKVLRVDEGNRRIFVKGSGTLISSIRDSDKALSFAERLKVIVRSEKPDWDTNWKVSVFSEKKYAGYKTEEALAEFVKEGAWEKNYLAEYDDSTRTLTLFPAQPDKMKRFRLQSASQKK